jgi:TldD protein
MNSILDRLDLSDKNCFYCDVRIEDVEQTQIVYRDGQLENFGLRPSIGAFIRVFNRGRWFYQSTTQLDQIDLLIDGLIAQSHRLPPASNSPSDRILKRFARGIKPYQEKKLIEDSTSLRKVSAAQKRELCESYISIAAKEPLIRQCLIHYNDLAKRKYFLSSKGASYAFDYQQMGLRVGYTLKEGQSLFDDRYQISSNHFKSLRGHQADAEKSVQESKAFLKAPVIEPGAYTMILDRDPVGIFAHESFGHKSEADFMMGDDHALSEWRIGSKVASEAVSIVDDGTREGSSGYCPWDDEGMPAQKNYLIEKGILKGRLHSQSTAMELDEDATGNGRAQDFEFEPIVRMTSTFIEPGSLTFEELVSKVKDGIYIKEVRSGMGMSTFTMVPSRCYRIENGKITTPVRVNVISGSVFETLNQVEACSKDFELSSSAFGGCGKGEQWPLPVAFGGPHILVHGMNAS